VLYAVTYEGVRIGTAQQQPQGSRLTRWLARSAITNETASFPTRRQASTWLTAQYLAQRNRTRKTGHLQKPPGALLGIMIPWS